MLIVAIRQPSYLTSRLRAFTPPTLVLWGRHDPYFPEPGAHANLRMFQTPSYTCSTQATLPWKTT